MIDDLKKIIVRFPPSPTGELHIGNIRTFLFNYLFARKHNGKIIMRFEDTDLERSKKEYEQIALDTLAKLGLDFDEGPFWQSKRTDLYLDTLKKLISDGKAYEAEESKSGQGRVIRFKNPNKEIVFNDIIRGEIKIDTTDFGDFVIARSLTNPLYHLTVVVDDIDMHITHIIRGEDHITSTPRQILLFEALGATIPSFAHLPLIIGKDKKKLGKRHGATTFAEFEKLGILPEAIINYLALLGWNPGDDREFFTKKDLIKEFSLERVNNSPATFDYEKLYSINKQHINKLSDDEFESLVIKFIPKNILTSLSAKQKNLLIHTVIKERINKFSDIDELFNPAGELSWLAEQNINYEPDKLIWKKSDKNKTIQNLELILELIQNTNNDFSAEVIKSKIWPIAEKEGKGDVLWPLRYAITGVDRSPDPFISSALAGKEITILRLKNAIDKLRAYER